MSKIDNLPEEKPTVQEEQQIQTSIARPLHRQFTTKFIGIVLTMAVALFLIFTLFYQQSERSRFLIDSELTPLKQELKQLKTLQKAQAVVNKVLLTDNGKNLLAFHTELIAVNNQLLQLESSHTHLYQQWLNENKNASDIVMRIQKKHGRNEQLKQSSINQLQLMLVSVTPIIHQKTTQQALLFEQLNTAKTTSKLTLNSTNAYAEAIQQRYHLQQLRSLSMGVLTRFEQLTIHTSMDEFDLLRLEVQQILSQRDALKKDKSKAIIAINQQIDTFEEIVITKQGALAKWQGHIRLAQRYQLDLKEQQKQLVQMVTEPQEKLTLHASGTIDELLAQLDELLAQYNIKLTQEALSKILLLAIGLSLVFFCFLLLRLRKQIKVTAHQSVALIQETIEAEDSHSIQANCAETQEIMRQVSNIAKPVHTEQEFQQLLHQCQLHQQHIDEQAQSLLSYTQDTNQQQLESTNQVAFYLGGELQRYKYLEEKLLFFIQQQQAELLNKTDKNKVNHSAQLLSLLSVYEQLEQFYLASNIRSKSSVLTLVDVNLIEEMQAILLNKQAEQQKFSNQLYFSYDEQLLIQAKLDFRLFQQLMSLFIDLALKNYQNTQLHLHLHLKDKSEGQQLVHFVIKVNSESIERLPDVVTRLTDPQTSNIAESPLVDMFNVLCAKQHGENITAHLIDNGFQFSFELPVALASLSVVKTQQESQLDAIKVMLLSSNSVLTKVVEKLILSVSGQVEVLRRIDSFEQQFTAKRLSKRKLDLLIVTSDVVQTNFDLIMQQINCLPTSLQPKLLVLQSATLSLEEFGYYSQTEQLLFKEQFFQNIRELLVSPAKSNQLLSSEQCVEAQCVARGLPIILAVHSPQKHQNLQRLLHWLGLQVSVVSHENAQRERWQTGLYCILITEFPESALLEMASKPSVDVAVFSLTDTVPSSEGNAFVDKWHIGQLATPSSLSDLKAALAPWLANIALPDDLENSAIILPEESIEEDELVITELIASFDEEGEEAAFDFSRYLHHHGSVELALFMLGDYGQDNHQKLDLLVNAIKSKDFDKAKECVLDLQLNAKILAAPALEQLCSQWSKLLSGDDIPDSLEAVNTLLKDTRAVLKTIDNYADSI